MQTPERLRAMLGTTGGGPAEYDVGTRPSKGLATPEHSIETARLILIGAFERFPDRGYGEGQGEPSVASAVIEASSSTRRGTQSRFSVGVFREQ
jgi:hypothetical protein